MPLKKKPAPAKGADKPAAEPARGREAGERGVARKAVPAGPRAAAVAVAQSPPDQLDLYQSAIRLFHAGKFREARELFRVVAAGPDRGIAHRADLHTAMCERRLAHSTTEPVTAEEHYNYGIALINSRDLTTARTHLEAALRMQPGADHVHFALALCQALSGDLASAYENLKRAIEIDPRNRLAARQDTDFAPLLHHPPLDALMH